MADKKYYIAKGKSLTTKQGVKGENFEITTENTGCDVKRLDELVVKGLATNTKPDLRTEAQKKADAEAKAKADAEKKFQDLKAEAKKLKVEFTDSISFADLQKLVKEAKK